MSKFKVGDSVSIKKNPIDGWLVLQVWEPYSKEPQYRYTIVNPHEQKLMVRENEIEATR